MQPPGKERPPSSSTSPPLASKRIRLITNEGDGGEIETTESVALVSPLENDDLVADSLLYLPALPSSLLRASLVCKRWCRVLSNPRFLRDFRAHHGNPPLLGLFYCNWGRIIFTPMLEPPNEIPPKRFALGIPAGATLLSCNHGRVLIHNDVERHFLVWDPITGELCRIPTLPSFRPGIMSSIDGAVVCASTDQGHVHGACHSDPFRIVVVAGDSERFYGCAYSSETRAWGELFSVMRPPHLKKVRAPTCTKVFGNSIFSLIIWGKLVIVEFDWARQNLALIDAPYELDFYDFIADKCQFLIKPSDGGGLSFIVQEAFTVHVWKRTTDADGVATWMLGNTIDMSSLLLSIGLQADSWTRPLILAVDGDGNVLFKMMNSRVVFMANLESRKIKKLPKTYPFVVGHPFSSFYTPGMHVNIGRDDEVQKIPGA